MDRLFATYAGWLGPAIAYFEGVRAPVAGVKDNGAQRRAVRDDVLVGFIEAHEGASPACAATTMSVTLEVTGAARCDHRDLGA